MYKIKKITFKNHPVLRNLSLDFCDTDGNIVDTIIFAGENGTGKSTILDELYKISSHEIEHDCDVDIEVDGKVFKLEYRMMDHPSERKFMHIRAQGIINDYIYSSDFKRKFDFHGIFSDVDINFHSNDISNVTSLTLDETKNSRRSAGNLPTQINQLLVDVQALDDADISRELRRNPSVSYNQIDIDERMPRFTKAFKYIFDNLTYSHINTQNGRKNIVFSKYGNEIPIEALSSGEKQIVYRGGFLLKDVNAMNGAFVFIDEPEISLHPSWQMKIMDYYKGIFTDKNGIQTSQIFVVTHSPFIIHNENRKNDKVIVLSHDKEGNIIIKDRQEYFKCDSMEVVQDAFHIHGFSSDESVVYLEGRTDEQYFKKAIKVFGYSDLPFIFKWVGYLDNKGQEANTGKDALNKASHFLIARNLQVKNVCLFDCDTKREVCEKNNVYIRTIPHYSNKKHMNRGIENALILDDIDISSFYIKREKTDDYGATSIIRELDKMKLCEYICSMDDESLKNIFANLKKEIDYLYDIFAED